LEAHIKELRERARAAGYDPNRAMERLDYGSFVSPARRYMYVETPKAACTYLKHVIASIEGVLPDPALPPYQRETRPDLVIHQRRHIAMPTLLDVDAGSRAAILGGNPGWLVFALVRNPYSRLVSFFENKLRLGEPGYRNLEARYGDPDRFGGLVPAFSAFVAEVVTDPRLIRGDSHLLPQTDVIMPRLIPYTRIFHLEKIGEAMAALAAHLAGGGGTPRAPHNRSLGRDWRRYYDAPTAAIVASAYAEDFASFGFDPADWAADTQQPLTQSQDEVYWRGEVAQRNAMIESLYDRLGLASAGTPADANCRRD
jgi:hypothetical protein